jgi:hypothetical protein
MDASAACSVRPYAAQPRFSGAPRADEGANRRESPRGQEETGTPIADMAKKPDTTHPNAAAFPPGMSGPALRALAGAGIRSLSDVARRAESDLARLHGMGPKALGILKSALAARGTRPPRG